MDELKRPEVVAVKFFADDTCVVMAFLRSPLSGIEPGFFRNSDCILMVATPPHPSVSEVEAVIAHGLNDAAKQHNITVEDVMGQIYG
jgi:hypothetical protein